MRFSLFLLLVAVCCISIDAAKVKCNSDTDCKNGFCGRKKICVNYRKTGQGCNAKRPLQSRCQPGTSCIKSKCVADSASNIDQKSQPQVTPTTKPKAAPVNPQPTRVSPPVSFPAVVDVSSNADETGVESMVDPEAVKSASLGDKFADLSPAGCGALATCQACGAKPNCRWIYGTGCIFGMGPSICSAGADVAPTCGAFQSCESCTSQSGCIFFRGTCTYSRGGGCQNDPENCVNLPRDCARAARNTNDLLTIMALSGGGHGGQGTTARVADPPPGSAQAANPTADLVNVMAMQHMMNGMNGGNGMESDVAKMLMMQQMAQGGGGVGSNLPLLMAMNSGKQTGNNDLAKTMLVSQALGGGANANAAMMMMAMDRNSPNTMGGGNNDLARMMALQQVAAGGAGASAAIPLLAMAGNSGDNDMLTNMVMLNAMNQNNAATTSERAGPPPAGGAPNAAAMLMMGVDPKTIAMAQLAGSGAPANNNALQTMALAAAMTNNPQANLERGTKQQMNAWQQANRPVVPAFGAGQAYGQFLPPLPLPLPQQQFGNQRPNLSFRTEENVSGAGTAGEEFAAAEATKEEKPVP